MRERQYVFRSLWRVRASLDVSWAFLTAPGQRWGTWWPGLREIDVRHTDGLVGSWARCAWRSPFGYALTTELTLVEMVPLERVLLVARGDLAGDAAVTFFASGADTRIVTEWQVTTVRPWMNAVAPVLGPLFTLGHHLVMRGGEHGLNTALDRPRRHTAGSRRRPIG